MRLGVRKENLICCICGKPIEENQDYYPVNHMHYYYDLEAGLHGYKEIKNVKVMHEECYKTEFLKLCKS